MSDLHTWVVPHQISALMADLSCRWGICGGWALDLFTGTLSRPHKDIDIAILRRDQLVLQTYLYERGWTLEKAHAGNLSLWLPGEYLTLPTHGIWCNQAHFEPNFLEVLLNEATDTHWLFRRDQTITCGLEQAFLFSQSGIPILAPEIVLLYKSKYVADEHTVADFQNVLPLLDTNRRHWLCDALFTLNPDHPWIALLTP
ncbi:MAG: amino acid transporter [Blastochloris sp.]|nr:amino acid transporter [Blastochloris sp.]